MKFKCSVCGWIYDETEEGKKFDELEQDWKCPVCFASSDEFEPIDEN